MIKNIMHSPTFVSPSDTIEDVCKIMAKKIVGSVIVGTKDEPLGIFSERDVIFKIVAEGIDPKKAKASEYMTSPVITIDAGSAISDAQRIFSEKKIRRLPVVENKIIVGIVSARSVLNNINFDSIKRKYFDSLEPSRF
ncbi:MAG: CBS domain-containing protein [archaeon]